LVKAEEAIAFLLLLLGVGGSQKDDKQKDKPPSEQEPPIIFPPPREPDPTIPEGCGPKPTPVFKKGAGYWWQPATDAIGWFITIETRPPDSVILSINEDFRQELQTWYKCDTLTDPIRLITQFI